MKRILYFLLVISVGATILFGCSNSNNSSGGGSYAPAVNNEIQKSAKKSILDSKLVEIYLSSKETQRYNKEHNIWGEDDAKFDSDGRLWVKCFAPGDMVRETHEMFTNYTYTIYKSEKDYIVYLKYESTNMNTDLVVSTEYYKYEYNDDNFDRKDITSSDFEKIQNEFENMKDCYDELLNNNSLLIIEDKNQEEMDDTFDSNYYEEAEDSIIEKKMNKEYFWVILKEVATPKNNHFVEIMGENFWEEECLSDKFKETYDIKNGILGISDTDSIQDISITNFDFDNQMIDLRVEFSDRTSKEYVVKWKANNNLELDEVSVSEKNNAIRQGRKIGADETMPTFETVPNNKASIIENLASRVNEIKLVKEYSRDTMIDEIDTVTFGSYPQSDASGNTKEPIEWIVLEKSSGSALLLSKYIIDSKCYKDRKGNMLKKWLNSTFYNNAFNVEEQNLILTDRDSNTDVFCLSVSDIEEYFNLGSSKNSYQHECLATYGTNFAKSVDDHGDKLQVSTGKNGDQKYVGCSPWWTQSKGNDTDRIIIVGSSGAYLYDGRNIRNVSGVRPAIWVSLK